MSWSAGERLYALLPAVHRIRDHAEGEPLRALLSVIESELETLEADIDGLYDNAFIETCDPWVIPYIGDLVGSRPLHEATRPRRADVAKTLYYRRRKATVPMLTELARDVTGWDAHVVEFFRLLAWTQHVNHRRLAVAPNPIAGSAAVFARAARPGTASNPAVARLDPFAADAVGTVHLRHLDALDRIDGPFDVASHTADVRPAEALRDRYNIRKLGVFLWRIESYALRDVTPAPSANATDAGVAYGFHLSPLGAPLPLYGRPRAAGGKAGATAEERVGGPLRPLALHADLEACRIAAVSGTSRESVYAGAQRSLAIVAGGAELAPERMVVMDLETWHRPPAEVRYRTEDGSEVALEVDAGVDPGRGRLVFAEGREPDPGALRASYAYGFSADLGGGPYRRPGGPASATFTRSVSGAPSELDAAIVEWNAAPPGERALAVISIEDSATYTVSEPLDFGAGERLVIRAADGERPAVRVLAAGAEWVARGAAGEDDDAGSLELDGLLVEGAIRVERNLRGLAIRHCTLVPGRGRDEDGEPVGPGDPSVTVDPANDRLELSLERSIVGPLRLPAEMVGLTARDTVVDAPRGAAVAIAADPAGDEAGPPATLERVTVLGAVHVVELALGSETIFDGPVRVERRQRGCVRFSYVRPGSVTPRRYRCQPDLAAAAALEAGGQAAALAAARRITPSFTSTRYGDPGYAQLGRHCAGEIRTGAEDGSEMGAFSGLKQPQREANLRIRLDEYLPFGLEPVATYVT